MTKLFRNNRVKFGAVSILLAAMFSLSANAAITFSASGSPSVLINSGDSYRTPDITFSPSTSGSTDLQITSVQLVLSFLSADGLNGNDADNPGFQGTITLGGTETSPYISVYPTVSSSLGTYDVTFTGTAIDNTGLNGLSPNGIWVLDIWNNGLSGNTLASWSLDVTAVPEPVNVALGVFGLLFAVVIVARRRARKPVASRPV